MTLNFAFLAAAAVLIASPVAIVAAETAPVSGAALVNTTRFPNADTVVLDTDQSVVVNADGGYVRRSFTRTRILTEEGRQESQSFSVGFNRAYGTTAITLLKIVKSDGRTVALDLVKQSAE